MSSESSPPLTALGSLRQRVAPHHAWTDDERDEILTNLYPTGDDAAAFTWRFITLIVLSTLIAAFGLLADSAAVVIGAMLVAPLMTPILGIAVAIVMGDARRLLASLALVTGGILLAIASAGLVSWITEGAITGEELTSELLARTEPTMLDLGVAIAAGLAAGYVLVHPRASASLPGAAIAVALVPPLATAGIGLHLGASDEARGALLLFVTNLLAIILAAMFVTLLSGFAAVRPIQALRRGAGTGLVVTAVMLLIVALPLSLHTIEVVEDRDFTSEVASAIREWDPNGSIIDLSADVRSDGSGEVSLVMATNGTTVPAWQLAQTIRDRTGLSVAVDLQYSLRSVDSAVAD